MFRPNAAITIRRPRRTSDGGDTFAETAAAALRIDCDNREFFGLPAVHTRAIFLVPPPGAPEIGDSIVCDGVVYDLKSVSPCRDLDGKVVAVRCLAEI